jgi:enterochelin esterase-like enzyme
VPIVAIRLTPAGHAAVTMQRSAPATRRYARSRRACVERRWRVLASTWAKRTALSWGGRTSSGGSVRRWPWHDATVEKVRPVSSGRGELVTETLPYDGGGRQVTVYVPTGAPEAVVFTGDGQVLAPWGADLSRVIAVPPTMVVGVHRAADETRRLEEYSPGFAPERFTAHETFVVHDVRRWVRARFAVSLPSDRTALFGVSASAELALAIGMRHPETFGAVLAASPGAGYRPPVPLPADIPRVYLVAGKQEPFFLDNANRWASVLTARRADVIMKERAGSHGGEFWRRELPLMAAWAFHSDDR